jgi:large repetitive protein
MRRLSLSFAVLALSLVGVSVVPQQSAAAPLSAPYTATASGDLVAIRDLVNANGPGLGAARLAVAESTMSGGASPTSRASVRNLGAGLPGPGLAVQSRTQTAPPDHASPDTGPVVGASASGMFDLSPLNASVHARTRDPIACSPAGGPIANSQAQTTAILNPTGAGTVVDTGNATTTGVVSIVPEPPSDPFNRAVRSVATGSITTNDFLDGAIHVDIAGTSSLQAFATGEPGGADVSYNPGAVTVTVGSTTTPVGPGPATHFDVPAGRVSITVNQPKDVDESPNGQHASANVAVVTAQIRVGPVSSPSATVTVDLLPLRVSADVPLGGLDCAPPPPVLNTPADGSTLTDTTPTFTGTAVPDAQVDILVDGNPIPIGTTTANGVGNFSFAPSSPIPSGDHVAFARAIVNGARSVPSNLNDFTILGPPVLEDPADGTVTNDTTPTFAGTTLPGAQVDILVDGNPIPIGTTTANAAGDFSFTPGTPIPPGNHLARARAMLNGATSPPSNINDFTIDTEAPAAPTLVRPSDGSVTRDRTPTFRGRAEPGSEVEVFVDGTSIGTTTTNGDGGFSFTPAAALAAGPHEAFVGATDAAGNDSPPSNTNDFLIDTEDPAAPVITSPADGGTTTDPTPPISGTADPGSQVIIFIDGEQVGSITADENGNFTFTVPDGLVLGEHEVSAIAVDQAGNRSDASDPVSFGVLAAQADAGPGQNSLAQTGGPQGWLPIAAAIGVLAGTGILAATRWRRRSSQV